jgi:ATP-dependent Clp protease ATP-binding subunit ClpB
VEFLAERGYDAAYGARPMRRLIMRLIEDPLAVLMVSGECLPGSTVRVRAKGEELTLKVQKSKPELRHEPAAARS